MVGLRWEEGKEVARVQQLDPLPDALSYGVQHFLDGSYLIQLWTLPRDTN